MGAGTGRGIEVGRKIKPGEGTCPEASFIGPNCLFGHFLEEQIRNKTLALEMGQTHGIEQHEQQMQPISSDGFSCMEPPNAAVVSKLSSCTTTSSCSTAAGGGASTRNLRNNFQLQHQQQLDEQQRQQRRQSRSKSLEPRATLEIRAMEHSKSTRYGAGGRNGSSASGKSRAKELWNPEKATAQLIGLQLQNPHKQHPPLELGVQQMRQFRKQSGQTDMFEDTKKDAVTGLTAHQIQILQKIWERSPESEISDCARNIMSHLLRSNAQMYQFFDLLGQSDREILNSSTFMRQSANFAIVLDFVLANLLDEVQKVCLALQHLGAQHARLPWPIEAHHWALFTRCFEDNPPKEVFLNAEGHDLWKTMINFIVIQMRIGYDQSAGPATVSSSDHGPPASSPRIGAYRSQQKREKYGKAMRANTVVESGRMYSAEEEEEEERQL